MLPASGQTTCRANATATVASMALPPFFITSVPTREAISLTEATTACFARTGSVMTGPAARGLATRRSRKATNLFTRREVYSDQLR